jgi:hypothetical protein
MFLEKFIIIFISLIPFINFAQTDALEELQSHPAYEVILRPDSTLEIYNKHQNYRYLKTIRQMSEYESTTQANLIIELDTVNFAAYENLYRRWGSIPGINPRGRYISVDANGNGRNEVFVFKVYFDNPPGYPSVQIYEKEIDSIFNIVFEFPQDSLGNIYDSGDITGDGLLEVIIRNNQNKIYCFKQAAPNTYINELNFIYNPFPTVYQPNKATFYDIDGDGNLEIIYFLAAGSLDSVWAGSNHVAKYNPGINNFELVYYHRPQPEWYTNGISTGDFDQDGKGNFATGSIYGKFYIYEHVQGTEYQVEFTTELQTSNAYLTTFTNDMDGNGKPEIWIGGDIGGVTRLYAFEAAEPGAYEQVYQIDILGLSSFIDGKMRYVDLDGDGNKELFLTNANLSFGFKYDGNGNYYMDFVIPAPRLDSIYTTQNLERIDIADLDGNGVMEIVPQYFLSKGWPESYEYRSVFLKRDNLTSINESETILPARYNLFQNYPNPFNPSTSIRFEIPERSIVSVKAYDILGKEIISLIDKELSPGSHAIDWEAKDSHDRLLPSGVYLIRLSAANKAVHYTQTIKALLLK